MSRSYKKTSFVKDNGAYSSFAKKKANKRVRQSKHISSGSNYKRVYPQYDICDFRYFVTKDKFKSEKAWKQFISK